MTQERQKVVRQSHFGVQCSKYLDEPLALRDGIEQQNQYVICIQLYREMKAEDDANGIKM